MSQVKWGIIGPGRIAHQFARDIVHAPSARLVAVASRNGERAAAFAGQYDVEFETDYQALCAHDDVDAIYIATPHTHHLDHGLLALKAGKPVVCEKPLTTNPEDSARLLTAASDAGLYLMEAMWTWFLPAMVKAKSWVDEGRIGEIVQIKADFGYPQVYDPTKREWDANLGGGCLLEMGVYPVAFDHLFTGKTANTLNVVSRLAPNGVEQDVSAVIDHGDITSTLGTSFMSRQPNTGYVIGTDGYIVVPDFFRASQARLHKVDDCLEHFRDERAGGGFEYEIEAASQDILAGRTQSDTMPHSASQAFQDTMAAIRAQF